MTGTVTLYGYRYSAYTRVAELVLLTKGVIFERIEVDPFSDPPAVSPPLHPFGRVPVLTHDEFRLFETNAITRYIDRSFPGPALQPGEPSYLARMDQVLSAIDAYAYWPMVRQVGSHGFFRPCFGHDVNPAELRAGLEASRPILDFLGRVAEEGYILNGDTLFLADLHLAPMIDYFVRASGGKAALSRHRALQSWWDRVSSLEAMLMTDPFPGR